MYSWITITNFRGIGALAVADLRPINLILGRNNSGKTTLLEGLFLLGGANDPRYATTLGRLRGQPAGGARSEQVWRSLFHRLDPKNQPEISGKWEQEPQPRELVIEAIDVSNYTGSFELSNAGGGGVAVVTPEFLFGGVRLRTKDAAGNDLAMEARLDPVSESIKLSGSRRADVIRTTLLSARAYP